MAIEAIVSKLSSEALAKASIKSDEMAKPQMQGSNFKDMLAQMDSGADFANTMGVGGNQDISPTSSVESLGGDGVDFTPATDATDLSKPAASEKVLDMLGEVNKGQMQMDSLVNHVLYSGKKFSNQELLVIQAHVFHFSQMTELTVKVTENAVSSVKNVLNTQVQ
ncbi:MAG: hypothetical protein V2A66_09905 [Pseudomonadota bacterium]